MKVYIVTEVDPYCCEETDCCHSSKEIVGVYTTRKQADKVRDSIKENYASIQEFELQ